MKTTIVFKPKRTGLNQNQNSQSPTTRFTIIFLEYLIQKSALLY